MKKDEQKAKEETKEEIQFPTWRYHATKPACIVKDAEELKALGAGWKDAPFPAEGEKKA